MPHTNTEQPISEVGWLCNRWSALKWVSQLIVVNCAITYMYMYTCMYSVGLVQFLGFNWVVLGRYSPDCVLVDQFSSLCHGDRNKGYKHVCISALQIEA